jgi:archaellum component FlaC
MKVTNSLIEELTNRVDLAVDSLMTKLEVQAQEIVSLRDENKHLKENYRQILKEIEQYVIQLEQIKSHYVNSNHNVK